MTLLEKLKAVTTVVADSGDMNAIREHHLKMPPPIRR